MPTVRGTTEGEGLFDSAGVVDSVDSAGVVDSTALVVGVDTIGMVPAGVLAETSSGVVTGGSATTAGPMAGAASLPPVADPAVSVACERFALLRDRWALCWALRRWTV